MAHPDTEATVTFSIKAATGADALVRVRNKVQQIAPGRIWECRSCIVKPANGPEPDGEHVGPPWLFHISVVLTIPTPHGG
jgi:hypothetical protein